MAAGAAYYVLLYRPAHQTPPEIAYVLPKSAEVWDSTAEVRAVVGRVEHGDRLEVFERTRNWARVRLEREDYGWVEKKDLLDAGTYEAGQQLLNKLRESSAQAAGHTVNVVNLRLEPSRDAPVLAQLDDREGVEVFGRRLIEPITQARPPATSEPGSASAGESPAPSSLAREAWYLIRAGSKAGWAIGRLVELDVPESIAEYAQGFNLVAWLELNRVEDDGRQVPQYFVADRLGTQELDFNHIRVLTWGTQNRRYATAYVESNLGGYFPVRVGQVKGIPHFRLRLMDGKGHKFQKVYGLFGTITRVIGTVDGWDSDAMPTQPVPRRRRVH